MAEGKNDYVGPTIIALMLVATGAWLLGAPYIRGAVWWLLSMQWVVIQVPVALVADAAFVERWQALLEAGPPEELSYQGVWAALTVGGELIRWPVAVLLGLIGGWILVRSPATRYTRVMNLESMLVAQAEVFPRIRPILHLKGRTTREERGNYWWPESEYEWAIKHGAISDPSTPAAARSSFQPAKAAQAFANQLGRRNPGLDRLDELGFHEELLLAILAGRLTGQKKESGILLDDAARGFGPQWGAYERFVRSIKGTRFDWPANGPWEIRLPRRSEKSLRKVLERIRQDDAAAPVRAILAQHAYTATVLVALMEAAQGTGIISTSDFIWVKAVDRDLFYGLNDVGRRVASVEGSGIRSHVQAERKAKKPLIKPHVVAAIAALKVGLEESAWAEPPAVNAETLVEIARRVEASLEEAMQREADNDAETDALASRAARAIEEEAARAA
jgi:intracellular multiplication protein IcmP